MSSITDKSFQLRSIQLCSKEAGSTTSASSVTPSPEEARGAGRTAAPACFSTLQSSDVLLDVGGDGSTPPWRYRCPAYIVQRSSVTLRDLLADSLENAEATVKVNGGPATGAAEDSLPPSCDGSSVVLPLPFVDRQVFEVVAVYMEHFYGVSGWDAATALAPDAVRGGQRLSASHNTALNHSADTPAALRRPLNFADLYALSPWEHHFVLHCLFGLPWQQITLLELVKEARWVDLAGWSADNRTGDLRPAPEALKVFSPANRQQMWTRLRGILEAATRLGVPALQQLCASVAANMLVDQDANGLVQLLKGEGEGTVPPFTPEARASLLQRFPWLSREEKNTAGAVVK
ncbi:hypothetical protein ABB37_05323 [Leptomonas pyrrhocoris]|uniref:Uncharacterized protein n=1 Tax=Leptomonas pyrrhocoris TaxID=157538 RepID=A0A0N0VEW5_LEPPY|nr:hypothetical protein ABB37_05323 [Leptomonas pyrrhocoris]KPA79494.1 hypothetical protein ABB37_05323 [Leptomonas pyrrhocoris]|eukprot:XP_015657933.1 hypothetical protein ABB37_05323 [Leptomonas pyrrhocoris]